MVTWDLSELYLLFLVTLQLFQLKEKLFKGMLNQVNVLALELNG